MVEFRWNKMSLFLIQLLQFTEVTRQNVLSFTVRAGDGLPLSCVKVIERQENCDRTSWFFKASGSRSEVELVSRGQLSEHAKDKSDRLGVSKKCSLVIKKVTGEDIGLYHCLQVTEQDIEETQVELSVLNMSEDEDGEQVMLSCSVSTRGWCRHTVKWMCEGNDVAEDKNMNMQTSQCSATVTFPTSNFKKSEYRQLFKCEVTDGFTRKVQLFPVSPQSSGEEPGGDATTSTIRTIESSTNSRADGVTPTTPLSWWFYIIVPIVLVAHVISVVAVISWKRTKGHKAQIDDNTGRSLNPAVTQSGPAANQDAADPEGDVSYASVSFTKKTNSEAQVRVTHVTDEGDSVIYSSVKSSSSSPSDLYATANKPNQ